MDVPFLDLERQYERYKPELTEAVQRVVDSQYFVNGPEVEQFEEEFANYLEVDHCLAVSSGTDAVELALDAEGIGDGDFVGVPAMSFIATAEAVLNVGAKPVYLDVRSNGLLSLDELDKHKSSLDAVIPVHLYGQPAPILEIEQLLPDDVVIVGDAAQAHGAQYRNGDYVGSRHTTAFSFYPTKNLGGWGDGGAVTTPRNAPANLVRLRRDHGRANGSHYLQGRNARMDEIQAAVLRAKLLHLDSWNMARREAAHFYTPRLLHTEVVVPPHNSYSVRHAYPVLLPKGIDRWIVRNQMEREGVYTKLYYEKVLPHYCSLRGIGYCPSELYTGKEFTSRCLSLPLFPEITVEEQDYVMTTLLEAIRDSR